MHLPPITVDDRPPLHKRAQYAPDLLPAAISVVSEKYVITLTTPSYYPDLLPTDDHNTRHVLKKCVALKGRVHRGYSCMKHG